MGVGPSNGNGTDGALGATAFPRHEQTFPALTSQEILRMRRFGEVRSYKDGEALFETGKPGPGMFVLLSGHVVITQRDGLGHVTPVIDQGPGQFLAEIGQRRLARELPDFAQEIARSLFDAERFTPHAVAHDNLYASAQ